MAVPQPTDARTPCPVCRAPIHPIAGRCKHCKTDLAALRQVRPAAGAALPPLAAAPARPAPQVVVPVAAAPSTYTDEPSWPILPPRPTGRLGAVGATGTASARRPAWKSWPVIVIMLATVAIVAAVVLMAFPPGGAAADTGTPGGKRGLEPPPAPEHMDQNPMVPSAPHSQITPPAPQAVPDPVPVPRHTPDPLPVDPDADPFTGLARPGGLGRGLKSPFGGGANGIGMFSQLLKHACDRFKACGNIDDTLRMTCDVTLRSIPQQPAPSCPAAQRCLDKVDQMSCSASGDDMTALLGIATSLQDCMDAMSC